MILNSVHVELPSIILTILLGALLDYGLSLYLLMDRSIIGAEVEFTIHLIQTINLFN